MNICPRHRSSERNTRATLDCWSARLGGEQPPCLSSESRWGAERGFDPRRSRFCHPEASRGAVGVDRVAQSKLRLFDSEAPARGGRPPGEPTGLSATVHVRGDANLDPQPVCGAFESRAFLLGSLGQRRALQLRQPLRAETRGASGGLLRRHGGSFYRQGGEVKAVGQALRSRSGATSAGRWWRRAASCWSR